LLRSCPDLTAQAVQRLAAGRSVLRGRRMTLDAAALSAERARLMA
jgi:hypothetical protein